MWRVGAMKLLVRTNDSSLACISITHEVTTLYEALGGNGSDNISPLGNFTG